MLLLLLLLPPLLRCHYYQHNYYYNYNYCLYYRSQRPICQATSSPKPLYLVRHPLPSPLRPLSLTLSSQPESKEFLSLPERLLRGSNSKGTFSCTFLTLWCWTEDQNALGISLYQHSHMTLLWPLTWLSIQAGSVNKVTCLEEILLRIIECHGSVEREWKMAM